MVAMVLGSRVMLTTVPMVEVVAVLDVLALITTCPVSTTVDIVSEEEIAVSSNFNVALVTSRVTVYIGRALCDQGSEGHPKNSHHCLQVIHLRSQQALTDDGLSLMKRIRVTTYFETMNFRPPDSQGSLKIHFGLRVGLGRQFFSIYLPLKNS